MRGFGAGEDSGGGAQATTYALAVPSIRYSVLAIRTRSPCAVRNEQAMDLYFNCGFGPTLT